MCDTPSHGFSHTVGGKTLVYSLISSLPPFVAGCIYAELLGTKPLFPGDDYIHQLRLISDVLGSPSEEDMHFIKSSRARAFMVKQVRLGAAAALTCGGAGTIQ